MRTELSDEIAPQAEVVRRVRAADVVVDGVAAAVGAVASGWARAGFVAREPAWHEAQLHHHRHVVLDEEVAGRVDVHEARLVRREGDAHVVVQDSVEADALDPEVGVRHGDVPAPVLAQRERAVAGADAALPVVREGLGLGRVDRDRYRGGAPTLSQTGEGVAGWGSVRERGREWEGLRTIAEPALAALPKMSPMQLASTIQSCAAPTRRAVQPSCSAGEAAGSCARHFPILAGV